MDILTYEVNEAAIQRGFECYKHNHLIPRIQYKGDGGYKGYRGSQEYENSPLTQSKKEFLV